MDRIKAIRLLEKYKSISRILGLPEDEELLDELVNMVDKYDSSVEKERSAKKNRWGENDFQHMISEEQTDLTRYELNDSITSNRENMVSFWSTLTEEDKSKFTIF